MRMQQVHNIETLSPSASVIISIALILLSGFLFTRITKLFKLPDVTAYILTGIILFFVIGSEFFINYKLHIRKSAGKEEAHV